MPPTHASLAVRLSPEDSASATLFALIAFVLVGPITSAPSGDPTGNDGQGSLLRQSFFLLTFCLSTFWVGGERLANVWRIVPMSILLVLAWCTASVAWAIDPSIALRRLALTGMIILSIFLLVERAGREKSTGAVRIALILMLLANYAAVIGWPTASIHQPGETDPSIVGAWHGILPSKNFTGAVCAITLLFFILDCRRLQLMARVLVIALAAFFLLRTESKTSMAWLGVALTFGVASLKYNPYYRLMVGFGLLAALVVAISGCYLFWDHITATFTNPESFTGRVQIWPVLLAYWLDHQWLGSGFGSFWGIGEPQPVSTYTDGWVSGIFSGHNGYLDLLVQVGLPGLLLALAAVVVVPIWRLVTSPSLDASRRSLLLSIVLFSIGHNLTESSFFDRDATVHVFAILAIALLWFEIRNPEAEETQA